jgi:uncharacterized protein (DUF1330 family)
MSSYFIVNIKMVDTNKYSEYLEYCDAVFKKYKGKYLAVDDKFQIIEGDYPYSRTVIMEFANENDFYDWYQSEDY